LTFRKTILFIALGATLSCRKHEIPPEQPAQVPPVEVPDDTSYKCGPLPPPPQIFGWTDSTTDENKNINAFFRNPLNGEELIVVVNGDAFGYNKMFAFNLRTKQSKFLAALDRFVPDVNSRGWIVFSTAEKNVFKVKANGDSLTQLTYLNIHSDPKWDHTEKSFHVFQQAAVFAENQLLKIKANGEIMAGFFTDMELTAPFRKSNKIIIQRRSSSQVTLIEKNLDLNTETPLISGPYEIQSKKSHFDYLTVDQDDQSLYWCNDGGIFKYTFASKRIDTVYRNCENTVYLRPVISKVTKEMTFCRREIRPVGTFILLHEYTSHEVDFLTGVKRQLKIL
jgi:hypothetical protein